jgi:hypothetical protein
VASLVLFWMGIAGLLRRRLRLADLLWLGLFGVGALLYTQLTNALRP